MLFVGYCFGMALALVLNIRHQRAFALRLFYAAIIVWAHYAYGAHSRSLGVTFYERCGEMQLLILVAALAIRCEAAIWVGLMAGAAVALNLVFYSMYPFPASLWAIYYSCINTIQVMQIACLVLVSPTTLPWIRKVLTNKRSERTWMLRLLEI